MNDPSAVPQPNHGRAILRGFLVSSGISAAIALLGVVTLSVGFGLLIIVPYPLIQILWIIPLFIYYWRSGRRNEGKGVLLSCALNVLLSVACWGAVLTGGFRNR